MAIDSQDGFNWLDGVERPFIGCDVTRMTRCIYPDDVDDVDDVDDAYL